MAFTKDPGKPKRVVIALGGNALGDTPEEQIERVRHAAPVLLDVIKDNNEIIITHGNGPQVGMIQKAFTLANKADAKVPFMELPECGAMSQGYIGYHLQQAIGAEMHKTGMRWHVASVVTQIEVDADDKSFDNPTKPIGEFMTKEEAEAKAAADPLFHYVEDSGRGYRRVVASPKPRKIVENESILNLLDNEFIVIACGGGGVPVIRDTDNYGCYKGVPAVIDKDMAGELLAEDCDADVLVLLTAVDHVAINFGKKNQQDLADITVSEAEDYADEGQFGKGSMEPKVRAAIKFCKSRANRVAIIGSLEKAPEAVRGESGTRIHY
ncbi:carbamate kinase [Coriobacteriales bacterium OH1046]|nr:carbamate kinase [Coriobacteriales bacterium OH1046]